MRRTGFSPEVRELIYARATDPDGLMRCERCGSGEYSDVQVHHRLPRRAGSTRRPEVNHAANGLALDGMCHLRTESYRTEAYENGWLLRSGATPSECPVLWRGVWVLLADDGSVVPWAGEAA